MDENEELLSALAELLGQRQEQGDEPTETRTSATPPPTEDFLDQLARCERMVNAQRADKWPGYYDRFAQ